MSTPLKNLIKTHSTITDDHPFAWEVQPTDQIRNVSLTTTHNLMQCPQPCGWRGWVKKTAYTPIPKIDSNAPEIPDPTQSA